MKKNSYIGKDGFKYWDITESRLAEYCYNIMAPVQLSYDENLSWDQFKAKYPGIAYAYRVQNRLSALEEGINSLQVFQKMISVDAFPITSMYRGITRYEWSRIILDLFLYRFTSARDCLYHIINEVYELEISGQSLNLNSIVKNIGSGHPTLIKRLKEISNYGRNLREERNQLAHQGFARPIENHTLFKAVSMYETIDGSSPMLKGGDYDLIKEYKRIISDINTDLHKHGDGLQKRSLAILTTVAREFRKRFRAKNKLGRYTYT